MGSDLHKVSVNLVNMDKAKCLSIIKPVKCHKLYEYTYLVLTGFQIVRHDTSNGPYLRNRVSTESRTANLLPQLHKLKLHKLHYN